MTVEEAIEALLDRPRSTDETADLIEAVMASMRIRARNSQRGGAVLAALHQRVQSWREVERLTGIPRETAAGRCHPTTRTRRRTSRSHACGLTNEERKQNMADQCARCHREAPPQEAADFIFWEALGDGSEVICPDCITGEERQAIDEAIVADLRQTDEVD